MGLRKLFQGIYARPLPVREMARAAPIYSNNLPERLLLHASYSPRRWTCRSCEITSINMASSLKPSDFKWGKLLGSLQLFRCIYKFDQRLPMPLDPQSETFKDVLREAISDQSKDLGDCKALINGILIHKDLQYTSGGTNNVELLLPFMNRVPSCAIKDEEISGITVFSGVISASAYLGPKETAFEAVSELKGDIINSLHSRLDILCEDAVPTDEASANPKADSEKDVPNDGVEPQDIFVMLKCGRSLLFPRRVLIPWLANVLICDYLQPSETVDVLGTHCGEMMSMDSPVSSTSAVEVEKEASPPDITSFGEAVLGGSRTLDDASGLADSGSAVRQRRESSSNYRHHLHLLLAAVALLIAVLVGWILVVN